MRIFHPDHPEIAEIGPVPTPGVREISADDLVAAFEQNGLGAEREFHGRRLVVTGIVGSVHRGRAHDLIVNLPGETFGIVACSFPMTAFDELADLGRREAIVVEGTFGGGRSMTVRLRDCRIVREERPAGEAA